MTGKIMTRVACILAAAAYPLPAQAAGDKVADQASCVERFGSFAMAESGEARFNKLGDLPPAALILTVFRKTDGCITPIVVRTGIGANVERHGNGKR